MSRTTLKDNELDGMVTRKVQQLYDTASNILGYDLHQICLESSQEVINSTVRVFSTIVRSNINLV